MIKRIINPSLVPKESSKSELAIVFIVIACMAMVVLTTHRVKDTKVTFSLPEKERVALAASAITRRDATAAVKLADYYRWSAQNLKEAERWYSYAAALGDSEASENALQVQKHLREESESDRTKWAERDRGKD